MAPHQRSVDGPLRSLQEWFAAVIMHPRSVQAGLRSAARAIGVDARSGSDRIVVSSAALSAQDRMGIYHFAYQARLVDCLADDFPCVAYALGSRAFARLAHDVINRFPSDHPNLNIYGRRLVQQCQDGTTRVPHRAFISELAELEWSMCEVLHAQAAPNLSQAALKAIPLRRWGAVRFRPSQTLRVHRTAYPVNRYLQAYREDRAPAIPARQASATAVYRQGFTVWRMDLTLPMCGILDSLCAGQPLARALATLESTTREADQRRLATQVMAWFRDWVEGGFFAAFQAGSPGHRPRTGTARRRTRRATR